MKIGSFFPNRPQSTFYAMAADDCSLHFDLDNLTEKQWADHVANLELTGMLQVALIAISKPDDYVGLYEEFQKEEWSQTLRRYSAFFENCGIEVIPPAHFIFGPKMTFYRDIADRLPNTELLSLYMVSGSNSVLHQDEAALAISQNVNSKFHFAQNAPEFGIPTPKTLITSKGGLGSEVVAKFYTENADSAGEIMMKILGLAGARNVTAISSVSAAQNYVSEYADNMPVLLQRKLNYADYTEMTVDLFVSNDEIAISNIRQILFADGLWVGNFVSKRHTLSDAQSQQLIRVGEYARTHGYSSEEGSNCGIDYFVGPNGEVTVTEINARWTGGLFPTQILERINHNNQDAVMWIDLAAVDQLPKFLDFIEAHLPSKTESDFAALSFGFSPFPQDMNGHPHIYVWMVVLGDFSAFVEAKRRFLGAQALPTSELIRIPKI